MTGGELKKIKVSIPGEMSKLDISQFIENKDNRIGNIKFFINDDDIKEADAWFVIEDPIRNNETCIVPKENIFYFGDSYTYGLGLDYKKIYVGILEKKLEKYNHLNFGLQGYSPKVYKYQLNKMINDNIFPKKIILALDFTDILENDDRWIDNLDKKKPPTINEKFIQKFVAI